MLPDADQLLAVARIARPHGVRGELSAVALWPPVLEAAAVLRGRLYLRTTAGTVRTVHVAAIRPHQDRWLVTLDEVATRDDADALRGAELCLTRDELPALPGGWYWEADLIGCRVIDRRLGCIGEVGGVHTDGPQPQLELAQPGAPPVRIPWVAALVVRVDPAAREVHTDLPDEYPGLAPR